MPVNKKDYPSNWPELTREVKAAAGWRCEWCNAPHKVVIRRKSPHDPVGWTAVEKVYNKASLPFQIDLRRRWEPTANMSWARLRYHGLTRISLRRRIWTGTRKTMHAKIWRRFVSGAIYNTTYYNILRTDCMGGFMHGSINCGWNYE